MTRTSALMASLLTVISPSATEIPWPAPQVLFRSVQVFDGDRMVPARNVLVVDGKIAGIGQGIAAPEGARIIEGQAERWCRV